MLGDGRRDEPRGDRRAVVVQHGRELGRVDFKFGDQERAPAGWTEVLRWLEPQSTAVVLAVNAHVADGRDPSWLWDVPYEVLRGHEVAASGERALDVAVRLDYGGVDHIVESDPLRAADRLTGDVNIIASYTQFTALTKASW